MEFPKFELDAPLDFESEEELQEELNKSNSKFFGPGEHTAKIVNVELHKNKNTGSIYAGDKRWIVARVDLEDLEGRAKSVYPLIPLVTVQYKGPNSDKSTTFLYKKYVEFMRAIGEEPTNTNFRKLGKKYFGSKKGLKLAVGRNVTFVMGFDGAYYVDRVADQDFRLMDNKTKEYVKEAGEEISCPDAASLEAAVAELGIKESQIQRFPEILEYKPSKQAVKKEEEKAPDFDNDSWD